MPVTRVVTVEVASEPVGPSLMTPVLSIVTDG